MGTVNDVAYTCDGRLLLGAGADKRILLWGAGSGQVRHTLTGHTDAVTCVVANPMDAASTVSCSADRAIKLWDLQRGYASRSIPCTKMPNALCLSSDGATILTGHLDGTMCLWDVRQSRAGSQPLAQVQDHAQAILCITNTSSDSQVLTLAKDNILRLWDFRALSVTRSLKAPSFTAGSVGSMGRHRCTAELSADGRWVAAGGIDGAVYVWDLHAGAAGGSSGGGGGGGVVRVDVLKHHKEPVVAAGWSSDCAMLVTADKAGGVAFWQCQ